MQTQETREKLLNKLREELTRERQVTASQLLGISRHYSIADFDQLKDLIEEKVREGGELDLFMILSYNFTPDIRDRAIFSPFLDRMALKAHDVLEIIQGLTDQKLTATLGFSGNPTKVEVPLVEEVIARYVRNLYLDAALSDKLRKVTGELVPEREQAMVKAILRDDVWQKAPWQNEAIALLYALSRKQFRVEKLVYLTTFITSNHPKDRTGLVRLIKEVIEAYEGEIRRLDKGGKMFFNETIRESYDGTEADQREKEKEKLEDQKRQLNAAMELAEDLSQNV